MNALVIIDTDPLTPATVFAPGGVEGIISKLETDVRAIERDITTEAGREAVKSLAYKIARSKTALDDMGKELVAEIKKKSGAIDAERRIIRDRLDALKDEVRGPLTEWEAAEAERVKDHEAGLCVIIESTRFVVPPTAEMIRQRFAEIAFYDCRDWQEFKERADAAYAEAKATLDAMEQAAEQREADAAELAALRKQAAERAEADRIAAEEKAKAERQAAEQAAAAERERIRADQQAKNDQAQAERAEADKIAAAARAVEQERERVARAKADEERATAKREANKKHVAKVHKEIGAALVAYLFHDTPDEEGDELVSTIVDHIAAGRIPHVSITY